MITASFKVTEDQMHELRGNARAKRMSVSDYLRYAALPKKPGREKILMKRHPVSGAWYNAAPPPRIPAPGELENALGDYL